MSINVFYIKYVSLSVDEDSIVSLLNTLLVDEHRTCKDFIEKIFIH